MLKYQLNFIKIMVITAFHRSLDDTAQLRGLRRDAIARHIESAGFELEGGMHRHELDRLERYVDELGFGDKYMQMREDGISVNGKGIPDLEVTFWNRRFSALADFLRYTYDKCDFKTNMRCGFHVSVRFADMDGAVSFFSAPSVQDEFRERFRVRFGHRLKYAARLDSMYCSGNNVDVASGVVTPSGEIFYLHEATIGIAAYPKNGVIEFRIMPHQESWIEAVMSLDWIVRTADAIYGAREGVAADSVLTPEMVKRDLEIVAHRRNPKMA